MAEMESAPTTNHRGITQYSARAMPTTKGSRSSSKGTQRSLSPKILRLKAICHFTDSSRLVGFKGLLLYMLGIIKKKREKPGPFSLQSHLYYIVVGWPSYHSDTVSPDGMVKYAVIVYHVNPDSCSVSATTVTLPSSKRHRSLLM